MSLRPMSDSNQSFTHQKQQFGKKNTNLAYDHKHCRRTRENIFSISLIFTLYLTIPLIVFQTCNDKTVVFFYHSYRDMSLIYRYLIFNIDIGNLR